MFQSLSIYSCSHFSIFSLLMQYLLEHNNVEYLNINVLLCEHRKQSVMRKFDFVPLVLQTADSLNAHRLFCVVEIPRHMGVLALFTEPGGFVFAAERVPCAQLCRPGTVPLSEILKQRRINDLRGRNHDCVTVFTKRFDHTRTVCAEPLFRYR